MRDVTGGRWRRTGVPGPGILRAAAVGAVAVATVGLAALAGAPPSGAALPPPAGCGFTLGAISQTGAAGTDGYFLALRPDGPAESCTTAVTFTVSAEPGAALLPTTGPYTDVRDDPLTTTQTVTFTPGRRGPFLGVGWGAEGCADPAVPGALAFTVGSRVAAVGIDPPACQPDDGPGAPHSTLSGVAIATDSEVGIAGTVDGAGYWTTDQTGSVTREGDAGPLGTPVAPSAPVVGVAGRPHGPGAWLVAADGGVFALGGAPFEGSLGGRTLDAPIVGLAADPAGTGYWLVGADGGVFAFGSARFAGSLGSVVLRAPVVGVAAAAGGGYWLVAADGGVFAFGGAPYRGSLGGVALAAPVSGLAADPAGTGYWLVGSDNGVFAFGSARFFGSSPGEGTGIP